MSVASWQKIHSVGRTNWAPTDPPVRQTDRQIDGRTELPYSRPIRAIAYMLSRVKNCTVFSLHSLTHKCDATKSAPPSQIMSCQRLTTLTTRWFHQQISDIYMVPPISVTCLRSAVTVSRSAQCYRRVRVVDFGFLLTDFHQIVVKRDFSPISKIRGPFKFRWWGKTLTPTIFFLKLFS